MKYDVIKQYTYTLEDKTYRVSIDDNDSETIFLYFKNEPTEKEIKNEVDKYINNRNIEEMPPEES